MFKRFFWLAMLALAADRAPAFSLLGPKPAGTSDADGFQEPVIAYFLSYDVGGPKNIGEEYRWNTPILNYAVDARFLDYFGSNGVAAVDQAAAIMNSVSNLSSYPADLANVPLSTRGYNSQAGALNLLDLKSTALHYMVEQMGLADPVRYVWCLRSRVEQPNQTCPLMDYLVIQRNFDPQTYLPSKFVNGNLYSYRIEEFCDASTTWKADAVETGGSFLPAVASGDAGLGGFWTGLTRDDVGGFRYLMRTNNINFESVSPDSTLLQTNYTAYQLLVTSNLTLLAAQGLTNDAPTLAAIYPGLAIASSTPLFTNLVSTNITTSFGNYYTDPYGTPPHQILTTNYTTNVVTWYRHTFANVITNSYYTNGPVINQTITVTPDPHLPANSGILVTNVTSSSSVAPMVMGDYYLMLANTCIPQIVSTQLTTVYASTNVTLTSTNALGDTTGQSFSQSVVTYFTNHVYVIHPCDRITGSVGLRQGMDHFTFARQNYDSLLGRFFQPITNRYTLVGVTNSTAVLQTFERVATQPDFLFTAEEESLTSGGTSYISVTRSVPNFDTSQINNPALVAGPGIMQPAISIAFNKGGPYLVNSGTNNLSESSAIGFYSFVWGSFDASANPPIVYPNNASLTNLENQVLIQVTPAGPALPNGAVGVNYTNMFSGFSAIGGTPPYTWTLAPGSPGLPPPLSLNPVTGKISGAPSTQNIYDFIIRLADSAARYVDRPYSITVTP